MIDFLTYNLLMNPVIQRRILTEVITIIKTQMAVAKLIIMALYWKNQTIVKREKK